MYMSAHYSHKESEVKLDFSYKTVILEACTGQNFLPLHIQKQSKHYVTRRI